jgi:hypothetical protein
MQRTSWSLYQVTDHAAGRAPVHWIIRSERPGAPGYLVQLCELAEDLHELREQVVLDSALAASYAGREPEVVRLGVSSPQHLDPACASPLHDLHGCELDVWVARPREAPGEVKLCLWTTDTEDAFWAFMADNEGDDHLETLARPAERLRARLWTRWDFRLWDSDLLLVPELSWLASDAWEAWDRHDEHDLEALRGPRQPTPDLGEEEYRRIWVDRFDRLIEQRRAIDDLRARTWDLAELAELDAAATHTRLDALLRELRDADTDELDWKPGLVWALCKAGPSSEREARLERWAASAEPLERALVSAYRVEIERYGEG